MNEPAAPPSAPAHWIDPAPEAARSTGRTGAIEAIGAVVFATEAGPPSPERLRWLAAQTSVLRDAVRGRGMFVFALCLFVTTWIAPLWSLTPLPLGRIGLARRARILERWERSPFGMSLFAVKAILSIVWCEHPESAREMGFDGQPLIPPAGTEASHG